MYALVAGDGREAILPVPLHDLFGGLDANTTQ